MNYDRVAPRLWMGGEVDLDHSYIEFNAIVLCAEEIQPVLPRFRGTTVRAPFDDSHTVNFQERMTIVMAGREVLRRLNLGQRILVTCHMGWNRSGLVTGLALKMGRRYSTERIIERIRQARGDNALSNPTFVRILRRFKSSVSNIL